MAESRGSWANRAEFFLSTLGYCIGLGTLTRFPYVVMRNGGGAFLIPYVVLMLIGGAPLFYMELLLGQFSGRSPLTLFIVCPILKGVGYSMTLLTFIASIYYMPFTWSVVYLVSSFNSEVPWKTCDNYWNTERCGDVFLNNSNGSNDSWPQKVSPAEEFWNEHVLGISNSDGIHDLGAVRWQLAVAHLSTWLLVFLCCLKGTATSGKVVYVTATLPFLLLAVLVGRGVTLEGSWQGLVFFLKPDFEVVLSLNIWVEAGIQTAFALGPGWGTLITMASFNKFNHKCYHDAIAIPLVTLLTAIFGGIAVFSVLGHLAWKYDVEVAKVAQSGPGLSYVAYPAAIAELPISPLWAVIFFLTLLTVAIDSQFASFETYVSGFLDLFPNFRRYKVWVAAAFASTCYLLGLPLCTNQRYAVVFYSSSEYYLIMASVACAILTSSCYFVNQAFCFSRLDWYAAALTFTVCAFLEVILVFYLYGIKRFCTDIALMFGSPPNHLLILCWLFVSPLLMAGMTFIGLSTLQPPRYDYSDYDYPDWAITLGWSVAALSFIPTPVFFVYVLSRGHLTPKGISKLFQPTEEWGPQDETLLDAYRRKWDNSLVLRGEKSPQQSTYL